MMQEQKKHEILGIEEEKNRLYEEFIKESK